MGFTRGNDVIRRGRTTIAERLCAPLALLGLLCAPAQAQEVVAAAADAPEAEARLESYPPAFFEQFQPVTALDMVDRIPGFTLRGGDGGRGFGEAETNFLINGRRPSTKSQGARDILSRISADTVKRIDVLDGDALDIPGLSGQVVDIVARAVDLSGQWRYAARFEEGTQPQLLEGEVTLSGTRGDVNFTLALESGQFRLSEDSTEQFFDGAGNQIEERTEDIRFDRLSPSANLNLTWTPSSGPSAGHVANLNVSIEKDNDNSQIRETFVALDASRNSGQSIGGNGENEVQLELGGDYSLPLKLGALDGRLKLIGLTSVEDGDERSVFVNFFDGQDGVRTIFAEDFRGGEAIARAEYAFPAGDAHDLQLSAEYAFNFLESETTFENNFIPATTDAVRVEEDRYDARLTDSWQAAPDLSVQLSAGVEWSRLQVVDPVSDARTFLRPKGFIATSYTVSDTYSVRARAERRVGQLDFGTFVSGRNLTDNLVTGGNDDIRPSQSWDLSLEFERTDDTLLSGRLRPYLELIDDPIDRVLLPGGIEGPGNLESARRYGLEGNATLLFDTLGVPGLRVEATAEIADSEIDDPLTGVTRQINNNLEWGYNLFARYDIPQTDYALSVRLRDDRNSPFFRLDDIRIVEVDKPFLSAAFLHKDVFGMQLEVIATNLLDNSVVQRRERFFTPDRRLGALTRVEEFRRDRGRRLSLVLTSTF